MFYDRKWWADNPEKFNKLSPDMQKIVQSFIDGHDIIYRGKQYDIQSWGFEGNIEDYKILGKKRARRFI